MKKKRTPKPTTDYLARIFGLDLRSLALFRIGVSLFILYDLISRSFDLTAHYTDAGAMPRGAAFQYFANGPLYQVWNPVYLSIHFLTGSAVGTAIIFLIHGAATIALLIGYRTRLVTFLVWYLLASLQARNPLVLSVGDDVLLVLLFFSIFLPLGERFSLDTRFKSASSSNLYLSPATAVYYLQLICVYFFGALLKSGVEWRSEGTALYYAFSIDQFALPAAKALLQHPSVLKVLTSAVWWAELLGGFLLLVPLPVLKLCGVLGLVGLQVGIGMTLALGHNPWVNTVVLLPFVPSFVWGPTPALEAARPSKKTWWREGLAVLLFAGVLIYNINWLLPIQRLLDYVELPILVARLEQYWGMFAPAPNRDDGWYVVPGRLENGSTVEAFRESRQVSYDKPRSAGDFYPNERWRKYMMNIGTRDYKDFRLPFMQYLCSRWNVRNSGADHLEQLSLYFMREVTPPPGQQANVQKLLFFDYVCSQ